MCECTPSHTLAHGHTYARRIHVYLPNIFACNYLYTPFMHKHGNEKREDPSTLNPKPQTLYPLQVPMQDWVDDLPPDDEAEDTDFSPSRSFSSDSVRR